MSAHANRRLGVVTAAALALTAPRAAATEAEAIVLTSAGPPGCVRDEALRAEIAELGSTVRDAGREQGARVFAIGVAPQVDGGLRVDLIVEDRVGDETRRSFSAASCDEATRALALFVATALAEGAPRRAPDPPRSIWPAPAEARRTAPPDRVGSGGVAADVFYGLVGGLDGVHAYGAARAFGGTRLGAAVTLASGERTAVTHVLVESKVAWASLGGIAAWGAPWNDSIAGFALEVGALAGQERGTVYEEGADAFGFRSSSSGKVFSVRGAPTTSRYLSPYLAGVLVLQAPLRGAIRPLLALGATYVPFAARQAAFVPTVHAGFAWQAW